MNHLRHFLPTQPMVHDFAESMQQWEIDYESTKRGDARIDGDGALVMAYERAAGERDLMRHVLGTPAPVRRPRRGQGEKGINSFLVALFLVAACAALPVLV